jgi:hypothetical protein
VLAAELYDHHSAEFGEDVSAELSDHELDSSRRGLRPLTCQPAFGGSFTRFARCGPSGDTLTPLA